MLKGFDRQALHARRLGLVHPVPVIIWSGRANCQKTFSPCWIFLRKTHKLPWNNLHHTQDTNAMPVKDDYLIPEWHAPPVCVPLSRPEPTTPMVRR